MIKSSLIVLFMWVIGHQAYAANVATSDVTNQAQAKKWHILFDMNYHYKISIMVKDHALIEAIPSYRVLEVLKIDIK
ncbi:hypothetical protein K2X05_14320, partial [bacterium]|nr:hypothetical protein [bacterium]